MGRSADATTGKRLNIFEKACGGMLAAVSDVTRNDIVETCNSKKIVLAFSAAQIAAAFAITVFTVGLVWLVLLVYTAICKNDPDTFVGNIYASLSSGKKTKPKGKGAPRTNKDTRRTQFGSTKKHSPNPCGGDTSELHQPSPTQQTNRPYNAKQNKGKTDPDSDSETLPKEPPVDQSSESSSESAPESEPEPTPAQVSEPLLEESPAAPPPESDSEPIVELLLTEPIAVQSTEP
ncbi:MAG: hypothetical protein LBB38_02045, partial [Puniceicoccales bacterium]|nr:hypothetical protein [Puniceicoccales bacterium]